ncbi:MAG: hypothetical protein PHO80_04050 [Candidatus Gracilibacteria bacterium]|nr:hypothetical protein [Candidatus Gracilibacteria bacterium]MDD4530694.1 hypothetical protein [Candidatus Gracilibacteria bacterium]
MNKLINDINYHRYNDDGFLALAFNKGIFRKDLFNDLIKLIDKLKEFYKGKPDLPRNLISDLFGINALLQAILEDVSLKKRDFNISDSELFDYTNDLYASILEFFND